MKKNAQRLTLFLKPENVKKAKLKALMEDIDLSDLINQLIEEESFELQEFFKSPKLKEKITKLSPK